MSGENNLNINKSLQGPGFELGGIKRSDLRKLFPVLGSDIGKSMNSGHTKPHYSPLEIVNGLKSSFADSTVSVVESEKFQQFLDSVDETNVADVYKMFSQISLTALIADDVMSSAEVRKESIMKLYDAVASRHGIVDSQKRENFQIELDNQFKKMGFMVKTDNLDKILKSMIES